MENYIDPLDGQNDPRPNPEKPIGKAVMINFVIMLVYMGIFSFYMSGPGEAGLAGLMGDAFLLVIQVGANLLVGTIMLFMEDKRHIGSAMIIAGLLSAVIGFGMCIGSAALFG